MKAYKAASSKTFWLAQWNRDNPNFKLDMNKANRWAKDYAKKKKAQIFTLYFQTLNALMSQNFSRLE